MQSLRIFSWAVIFTACSILASCGENHAPGSDTAASTANVIEYQVRGKVTELPDPNNPSSDFLIHHEPIPAFKGNFNETAPTGMNSMVMPFPLGDAVTLDGVNVGDILTISFAVNYNPDTGAVDGWHVTQLTPLPAETHLTFGKATEHDDHAGHNH